MSISQIIRQFLQGYERLHKSGMYYTVFPEKLITIAKSPGNWHTLIVLIQNHYCNKEEVIHCSSMCGIHAYNLFTKFHCKILLKFCLNVINFICLITTWVLYNSTGLDVWLDISCTQVSTLLIISSWWCCIPSILYWQQMFWMSWIVTWCSLPITLWTYIVPNFIKDLFPWYTFT